ncbi:hypothetical protein ACE6H2_006183 [Prunus campanulata]
MEEICITIASKIVEEPVALIGRQLNYLIYYDSNIESLKDALKKLDDKKNDVERSVDAAKRNGATIKDQVQSWLEDVSKTFREAQELETKVNMQRRCLYGLCPSLKSRYSLSRKTKKIAQAVLVLDLKLDEGLSNNVANPAPLEKLGSIISSDGFKGFESRKAVMNDVLSALKNEKSRIIGICGMGSVGKTTMVREIIKRLEGTSLFDDVVMATVSATVNIRTIQTEIADSLGMKFVEESESRRAQRLHERIKQSKRILIILDDVWSELKLQDVGILFRVHEGCKILLTSRNEEVCKAMGCKDNIFGVQALHEKEAWELFRVTVGESLDNNLDLVHTAKLIADECKGLPIAIITIGKTLLSIDKNEWDTVHDQLKNSLPRNIPGMEHEVYSCIKLSYDKLESDEVKSCFLLCCLFPEDYDVPIEYLVRFMVRSFDAEGGGGGWPGVQKVTNQEHCNAISLIDVKLDEDITDGLECPKLELLQLKNSSCSFEYSNHFIRWGPTTGNKDETSMASLDEVISLSDHLNVLAIKIPKVQMLPNDEFLLKSQPIRFHVSIGQPISWSYGEESFKYRMHGYLFENSLMLHGDVKEYLEIRAVRYFLKQSEDLSLHQTYNLKYVIEELDDEEGFQRLKVLSIKDDNDIEYLMNGIYWPRRRQPSFPILKSVTFKNCHKLKVVCPGKLPDKHSFMNLRSIEIDNCRELKYVFSLSVAQDLVQLQSFKVEKCHVEEIISKERMEDDNASHMITFPRLIVLKLSYISNIHGFYTGKQRDSTYEIIKPNDESVNKMKETRNDNQVAGLTSSKSKVAQVGASCNALFPSNCISWLPNLEQLVLDLLTSKQLNVVFDLEGHVSAFSKLQKLQVAYLYEIEHLWKNVQPGFQGFQNVRSLIITHCGYLKYLCPYEIYKLLVNLQEVKLEICMNMKTIVLAAASTEDSIHEEGKETGGSGTMTLFPKLLNCFCLEKLPSLERFCPDAYSFAWSSSTRTMKVSKCPKLKTLGFAPVSKKLPVVAENLSDDHVRGREELGGASSSSSSTGSRCASLVCLQSRPYTRNFTQILPRPVNREVTSTNLQTSSASDNLEDLNVQRCDLLEVIFLVQETPSTQAFDKLRELKLYKLPMLSHIWEKGLQVSSGFGNLRSLDVWRCDNLRYLFSPHIAKLLTYLETIKVFHCSAMEKIVGEAKGEGESIKDELTFPHLNSIELEDLPKLESFCSQTYTLKWPVLEKVRVEKCPKAFDPSV